MFKLKYVHFLLPFESIVTFEVFKLIEALLPSLPYFYSYLHWFFRSDTFVSIPFLFITYYISRNTKMSISHSFETQILPLDVCINFTHLVRQTPSTVGKITTSVQFFRPIVSTRFYTIDKRWTEFSMNDLC